MMGEWMLSAFLVASLICIVGDAPEDPAPVVVEQPRDRLFGRIDFMWWYLKKDDIPPLLTTGPDGTTGLPGEPGVSIFYGGSIISRHDRFIGIRPTLGYWFNEAETAGIETSLFFIERDSSILHIKRVTTPLFLLYTDANSGEQAVEQFSGLFPNGITRQGSVQVYGRKEIYGQDIRGLFEISRDETWKWTAIAGAKFIQFRNQLNIVTTGSDLPDLNVLFGVEDNYHAYDRFYGGQIGLRTEATFGSWFTNATVTCGLGSNEQRLVTHGQRLVHTPTSYNRRGAGLYIQRSNTGEDIRWAFSAVPEVNANVGWAPNDWFNIQVGYSLMVWLNVLRAGNQVDTVVNTNQLNGPDYEGPARPSIPWKQSTFWGQGVHLGLELRW
jgi:hypothetical protein